jgi:hypothetical protein
MRRTGTSGPARGTRIVDYTAERNKILGNLSVDEIYRRIKLARAQRRRRPAKTSTK